MAAQETKTVDARARGTLPRDFAKSTVILEKISDTELRIRKANKTEVDRVFPEQTATPLSDRDRDRFLELIENPPLPNAALREAMSEGGRAHG